MKLTPEPKFTFDAKLTVPGAASMAVVPFTARYLTPREFAEWNERAGKAEDDAAWLGEVLLDWGTAIEDEAGAPVPFSVQALRTLFRNYHPTSLEVLHQFRDALTLSREKNWRPPLPGSTASQ